METKGTSSWGERVRSARGGLTQEHVLNALAERGFDEKQNWLSRIENGQTKRIDFDELVALGRVLGEDPYYLLSGEKRDEAETPFVTKMRQYEKDGLDARGQYVVESVALLQVEDSRKRAAAALSEKAAKLLALFEALPADEQDALLIAAGSEGEPLPRRAARGRGQSSRQARTA